MPIQQTCPVRKAERVNAHAISMLLEAGPLAEAARPGQFIHVKCGHSRLLRRPISICDVEGETLRMVFEVRGEGTAWLAGREAGDRLDVLGPLGRGFDLTGGKILVVGGGIGVPPMLYAAKGAGKADAVLGFRSADRAMLLDEFNAVCGTVAVTSDDGSIGAGGFADGPVRALLQKEVYASVLACGPRVMLKAVARAAAEAGVRCQVSMEERMGCGVGACLVCACQTTDGHMKHVCKDGPVFEAGEVDWDA